MCANDFDQALWGPLFKRINFECRNSGERKLKRPALNLGIQYDYLQEIKNKNKTVTKDDIEVVYPDKILDGSGQEKPNPIHIFVSDLFADMLPGVGKDKVFVDGGIKQFLKMMMPPYTNEDPCIRKNQVISLTFSFALHYYRFIVDQCGGCPALVIGSYETSTGKTLTTKLILKTVSDTSHFLAQSSSEQSVNALKAKTSLPFSIDDIEIKSAEHKIILSSFNGATKTTIGRGREKPLAGLVLSKNFKENEVVEEKDDEGRAFIQIYDKKIDLDIEDAYDSEAEHADAMDDNQLCRDFLAKMTSKFLKNKNKKSNFQQKHQAACGIISEMKSAYGSRKVKCYALPLCCFLMLEEEVEELEDREIEQLFVEVYKDRASFIETLLECLEKTDKLLENHVKRRINSHEDPLDASGHNHDPEAVIGLVLTLFDEQTVVERTNIVKAFTKKNGKQVVAIAHTKLKKTNPELAKSVKDLKEACKDMENADVTTGINTFTKANAERHIGAKNTESKTSIEFSVNMFSEEMKQRLKTLFEMTDDHHDCSDSDLDEQVSQSQDYPGLYQSQGRETFKFCSFCDFKTRNEIEMVEHSQVHPQCQVCKKSFKTDIDLNEHIKVHTTYTCKVCNKEELVENKEKHENMHKKHKLQLKALGKGKVSKSTVKSKMTGYNLFVKEKFAEIATEQENLSNPEIMKIVGGKWKSMTSSEKKIYNDLADKRNDIGSSANIVVDDYSNTIKCCWCEKTFGDKDDAKKHMKEHMQRQVQDQLKKCSICGLMLNQTSLSDHMKTHTVSDKVGPPTTEEILEDEDDEIEEQVEREITLAEITEAPPTNADILDEQDIQDTNGAHEEQPTVEDGLEKGDSPVVVMVKMRTRFWPAEVLGSTPDSYEVTLCNRGERMTVKKKDCKDFVPGPELCKGQKRDWKECYKVALELLDTNTTTFE